MKIIPVFLPYAGCKHRCVFCDQLGSTGVTSPPPPKSIGEIIGEYLKTSDEYELAFYGGTFTALPMDLQKRYLEEVSKWLGKGVKYVRISTRPDEIDENEARFLWKMGVRVVEIGAQSMFDDVLEASRRGHTAKDVLRAVDILKRFGFSIGVHLMAGLPKSSFEKDVESAEMVSKLGIDTARIHPTLVFRGTELHRMMERGEYEPLSLEEAVEVSSEMLIRLEGRGVKVIRIGLHVPVELRKNVVAGPLHPSLGDMVRARVVRKIIEELGVKRVVLDGKHDGWFFGYGNRQVLGKLEVEKGNAMSFDGMEYERALRALLSLRLGEDFVR